ncbi:MAG TPA: hypothetical protein VH590_14255 [Ktedonobacterales bacterium]|jgi:hypothetical protein
MWKQILLLGLILGALQILLVLGWGVIVLWPFSWLLFGLFSILCCLVISALDGLLTSRRNLEPDAVFAPGLIVGGIAFLVEGIALVAAPDIVLTPIACPPGSCRGLGAGIGGVFILAVIGAFFLLEALLVGPLGGWLGGLLGKRRATAAGNLPAKKEI